MQMDEIIPLPMFSVSYAAGEQLKQMNSQVNSYRVLSHLCHQTKVVQNVVMAYGQWKQRGRYHVTH